VVSPNREVVLVLGIIKTGPEKASPEMIIDATLAGRLQAISELSEIIGPFTGGDGNKGTIFYRKWINHECSTLILIIE
jgi:hypothetical protein